MSMVDLIFFTSPIGLGHATRDVAIVQNLDDVSKKFVSGKGASELLSAYGFDTKDVYDPPLFDVEKGSLQRPLKWLLKYYQYYKECKRISKQILEDERPRMVVSDEDFASLSVAHGKKLKTILITDVLQTKFTTGLASIVEKKMNRSMKDIMKRCDYVILPERGPNEDNIIRAGPIVRPTNHSRNELRRLFSFDKKTIVVSIGGTDAGKFLIEKTIEAFKKLKTDADLVVVAGPSFQIRSDNVRNLGFVNNLHEVIYASDLVISLAGKSTIDESKAYGTPGIFIPIKGHFEQEDNAKEEGFSYNDIFRLDYLISNKLNESRRAVTSDGAKRAAEIIKNNL